MSAYYNEIDLHAAQWLRNLIAAGHIAPGVVDTRSIEDVQPDDLREFTQCHFFAGIGVWSYALRRAGWPDDRPVWTGSCPCQPFSAAGEGLAFADERHLWPAFHHLIKERRPAIVVGEQVASKAVDAWIDLVHADLEAVGYTFGSVPFPSAGVGAPHIRDRNYWVANANDGGRQRGRSGQAGNGRDSARVESERLCNAGSLGHTIGTGRQERERERGILGGARGTVKRKAAFGAGIHALRLANADQHGFSAGAGAELHDAKYHAEPCGGAVGLANADGIAGGQGRAVDKRSHQGGDAQPWTGLGGDGGTRIERPGPTNGFWRDADWLGCTDGKWRPVEPGTFPLAHGAAARVGRLHGYGNAINAEAARVWIECVMESI